MKLVTSGKKSFILARAANGTYYAVKNRCAHQGVDLSKGRLTGHMQTSAVGGYVFIQDYEVLRCPRHGYEYDLKTGCSWFDPQRVRIKTYTVKIEGGRVLVDI